MKSQFVIGLVLVTLFASVQAQDISYLLSIAGIVQREIKCILNKNEVCDIIGQAIKDLLPEALNNKCQNCNLRQKANARVLMEFMKARYPNEWNEIVKLYSTNDYMV